MVWVKLDDQFFRNPKARAAGKDGRALFVAGLCYSASTLTDGHIAADAIKPLCAEAEVKATTADRLVAVGLWDELDDGWQIHDFNHYNPPSEKIRQQREEGRERAARSRERRANEPRTYANGSRDPSSSRPLVVDSSSSLPSVEAPIEEEEDWATIEAKRRLAERRGPPVVDDVKWVRVVAAELRASGPPKPKLEVVRCGECSNGWVEDDRGDAVACPKCRAAS